MIAVNKDNDCSQQPIDTKDDFVFVCSDISYEPINWINVILEMYLHQVNIEKRYVA
jgi:hypothetical protein